MAVTSVGEIGLDLVVNKNDFNRQMSGIMGTAKKAAAALAGAFAIKTVVDFGKECLELGSDLSEVQNVVDITFPKMKAQVDEFAKSAISSFGLSETMAKRYTGTFGAMAKAFGFSESAAYDMGKTLTGLAGDIASFYNISQDEAYTKLKSVFTGETESLKDLGVVMTQNALDAYAMANGFGKTTQSMSEAEKVALRYQFVQDKLSAAQGDFARTSGSWANQVRILKLQFDSLKATIGQGLINLFTPVIKVINTVIGKLTTLANAFKSFTELITGKKSSGNNTSPISNLSDLAGDASGGMEDAASAADGLSNATSGVGAAAKKAAKEMRSLMGFDKINKVSSQSVDTGSSNTGSAGGKVSAVSDIGNAVDFGSLAQGETVIDEVDSRIQGLIERGKELANLFKAGFHIGFGDSEKKIESISTSINGIKKSLYDIFFSNEVISASEAFTDSIVSAFGKITGSLASIGLSIVDKLFGSLQKYLDQNAEFLKDRIVSIFDVSSEIFGLVGDLSVAIASVFDVFSGEDAKQCTADIISIFANGFVGAINAGITFVKDIISIIVTPIIKNIDKISLALSNKISFVRNILDTLCESFQNTLSSIGKMYDKHIKPFVDSFTEGISKIVGSVLDGYNNNIAPVLKTLSEKFGTMRKDHIQPVISKFVELIGKLADCIKALWDNVLQPLCQWIADSFGPVIGPVIEGLGDVFITVFGAIGDVVSGLMDALGGLIDFITGVFSGDWGKAWDGIKSIVTGCWDAISSATKTIWGGIKKVLSGVWSGLNKLGSSVFSGISKTVSGAWSEIKSGTSSIWKGIKSGLSGIWNGLKSGASSIFGGIGKTVSGVWSSVKSGTSNAWSGIKSGLSNVWSRIKTTASNTFSGIGNAISVAWNDVKTKTSSAWSSISSNLSSAWSGLKSSASSMFGSIKTSAVNAWSGISSSASNAFGRLSSTITGISGGIVNKLSAMASGIRRTFSGMFDSLFSIIRRPVNGVIGLMNGLISGVVSGINTILRAFNRLNIRIPSWVPVFGGRSLGFNFSQLTAPRIPYLAEGGYVKANTPQLAMIGDNKRYGEIVAPENKLQEMVDKAVRSAGNGITKEELEQIINRAVMRIVAALASMGFNIDGEQLAVMQKMAQNSIDRRYNIVDFT